MRKLPVYLSPIAEEKLTSILSYLREEWSERSANSYLETFLNKTEQISIHPRSCIESSEYKGLFKMVIEKHTSLFYRIYEDEIEIITIIDNRQNPDSIKKEIRKQSR
ncbi:MAG: type II toxin-antitoxin system RelE/ParE family toxin [Bacteroidetes bacterium]|jgi:plasmid stabilization system protein ParE|nr:type II toxin-antitoxin system RelE/ParE family toxin [Bacteroidota bacterium]MBT5531244.1 type II toxin-antitoxin system RelE/ParE family toxin [Cytophagia bacterium]MBT3424409.1 type II toxin-antitoxin system RelE/ParE family toxin [Bacteroidota bacterium]MBT3800173.1 type II toxin-antitoxin system RelE/ParE family toxin [Bacteroidota bacterium]MBT3933631.1 type II toxin-antitoxin system RelE/ParE family toxin [Bacteroidota bacterium]